ncbi:MAG: OmpA family protein [Stagnimonas sp.]|nr:OmpA family protein [Stagnimonas sp.]
MKNTTRAAIAATLVGLALPLHAEEVLDKRPYLSPMFAYTFEDADRASDAGLGFAISGGKVLNKYWNTELVGFWQRYDNTPGGSDWTDFGAKIDGLFFYSRNRAFSPYFGVGAGVQHTTLKGAGGASDTEPMVDAGLGFFKYFNVGSSHDLAIRADLRYRWAGLDNIKTAAPGTDDLAEPVLKVGLVVPFGPRPGAGSSTSATDGKPTTAKILDSDGDGIADANDRCPGSAKGAPVDAYGCTKEQLAAGSERQFDDVLFDFDKSDLTPAGIAILDNAASVVNSGEYKSLLINVSGHTDWIGSEGYNQALSERRANAAKTYLIKQGVDASRIRTFAFGETTPVADNESAEGRAKNRRAEVRTTAGE